MSAEVHVVHHPIPGRFTAEVDRHHAHLDYDIDGGIMYITHTVVPEAIGGRGIAARLMEAALAHARYEGLKVQPDCSYADAYLSKHPEHADLRA